MILKGTIWAKVDSPTMEPEIFKERLSVLTYKYLKSLIESKGKSSNTTKKSTSLPVERYEEVLLEFLKENQVEFLNHSGVLKAMKTGIEDVKKKK
jgi:hypothetical protein